MICFHRWKRFEDEIICTYVLARKNDPKTLKKLAARMGLPFNIVAYRACNFDKLLRGYTSIWKFSKQEKEVFDDLTTNKVIKMTPLL